MKKNSYESTDVTYHGGLEYGSDIHSVTIRTNYIVWDMIKVLDKNQLFGFHFQTKISTHKIIIIMSHEKEEMLDKARKLLVDFNDIPNVLFLSKLKKNKKGKKLFKIFMFIVFLSVFLLGLYSLGLYFYQHKLFYFEDKKEQKTEVDNNNNIKVVKLDIKKLKAIQESFDNENTIIEPKIMKAMDVTTAVISDMVPPSQKAKYSSQELVKNFKGKGGIKFIIDDSNQSREFNQTIQELNSYATNFIKNRDISRAIKHYNKILKSKNKSIKDEDIVNILSQKAKLHRLQGDLNSSKDSYAKSLEITTQLAKDNPQKYIATKAFNLSHLSQVERDLNLTKDADKHINEAKKEYHYGLSKFEKLYKSNKKKYNQDLAWNYNIVANFYLDDINDINKSIEYRLKALKLYQKLYKQNPNIALLPLFKTYNSLAKSYMLLGEIKEAKSNYQNGFKLISKSKYHYYIALSHHNLGFVYAQNMEFKKALNEYNISKSIYKSIDINSTNILEVDYDIASLYNYQKRFNIAIKSYKKLIQDYKILNKKSDIYRDKIAKIQNKIAWIYITQPKFKNYLKAKNILNCSIKLLLYKQDNLDYKKVLAQSYSYLAHLELLSNHIELALKYYQKSLSINKEFQTEMRYNILLISQNKFLKGFRNFELMLKKYKGIEQQAKILMEYGRFYTTINQEIAKEKLKNSLKLYNKLSKINNKKYIEIEIINNELKNYKG